MKTTLLITTACVICLLFCTVATASDDPADYPHRVLRNDTGMRVMVMLVEPAKKEAFYRGTRFDWSGHIPQAKYRGHTFFGLWKTPHDPFNYEAGAGPCDEFGIERPPGYDKAKPGEPFLKVGVGLLKRIDDKPYHFSVKYPVLDAGRWQEGSSGGRDVGVSFGHELRTDVDWGYRYEKTIQVLDDQPAFAISRRLKNTEGNDIKTASYNHNFVCIDDEPIGPSYELELSEELTAAVPLPAKLEGRKLTFTDKVEKPLMIYFEKWPADANRKIPFTITITNRRTGGRMEIEHRYLLSELRLWVAPSAICPEPFVNIDIGPAKTMEWSTTYRLGTVDEAEASR